MIQGRSDDHSYFYQNNKNNNCHHAKKPQHQPSEIFTHPFFLLLTKLINFSNPLIKKNTINADSTAHIAMKITKKIKIPFMISKITPPFIC